MFTYLQFLYLFISWQKIQSKQFAACASKHGDNVSYHKKTPACSKSCKNERECSEESQSDDKQNIDTDILETEKIAKTIEIKYEYYKNIYKTQVFTVYVITNTSFIFWNVDENKTNIINDFVVDSFVCDSDYTNNKSNDEEKCLMSDLTQTNTIQQNDDKSISEENNQIYEIAFAKNITIRKENQQTHIDIETSEYLIQHNLLFTYSQQNNMIVFDQFSNKLAPSCANLVNHNILDDEFANFINEIKNDINKYQINSKNIQLSDQNISLTQIKTQKYDWILVFLWIYKTEPKNLYTLRSDKGIPEMVKNLKKFYVEGIKNEIWKEMINFDICTKIYDELRRSLQPNDKREYLNQFSCKQKYLFNTLISCLNVKKIKNNDAAKLEKFVKQHTVFVNFYCGSKKKTVLQDKVMEILAEIIKKQYSDKNNTSDCHEQLVKILADELISVFTEFGLQNETVNLQYDSVSMKVDDAIKVFMQSSDQSKLAMTALYSLCNKIYVNKKLKSNEILEVLNNLKYMFECNREKYKEYEQNMQQMKSCQTKILKLFIKEVNTRLSMNNPGYIEYKQKRTFFMCTIAFFTSLIDKNKLTEEIDRNIVKFLHKMGYLVHKKYNSSLFEELQKVNDLKETCNKVLVNLRIVSGNMFELLKE